MKSIADLYWDETSEAHLWQAHHVTPDEVEEVIFGVPGEEPTYRMLRDGDFRFRPFGARDMDRAEKHGYRRG